MIVRNDQVTIRKLNNTNDDFTLLFKWLNDPKVLSYIEGPGTIFTWEQIIEKYRPRARGEEYVTSCIYSGASILGGETVIGKGVTVGSNAFIIR